MGVNYYLSTDASAPTLTGEVGSLTNLLDKCLVDGYGSKDPLGWSVAYTDTNRRAYLQPLGTNRLFLEVDDTAPGGVTTARQGLMRGLENMVGLDAGTKPFPLSGFVAVPKSNELNSTPRPWALIGDEALFYLVTNFGGSQVGVAFGDIVAASPGDDFATIIIGAPTSTSSGFAASNSLFFEGNSGNALANVKTNHWVARGLANIGGAAAFGKVIDTVLMGDNWVTSGSLTYPTPTRNSMLIAGPCLINEGGKNVVRGVMPGFYVSPHSGANVDDGVLLADIEGLPGRSVMIKRMNIRGESLSQYGLAAFDITGPWR